MKVEQAQRGGLLVPVLEKLPSHLMHPGQPEADREPLNSDEGKAG